MDLLKQEAVEWPDPLILESMEGEARAAIDNYFGVCPVCSKTDGYLNIGRDHWFYCDEHKTKWWAGSNLFSSWHEEDESTWEQNKATLADYTEVHKPQVE